MTPTEPTVPSPRARSLVQEALGVQLAITAIGGLIAVAGLAWTSGAVVRDNLDHWAAQWAAELNELGAAGWELSGILAEGTRAHFYFKRETR